MKNSMWVFLILLTATLISFVPLTSFADNLKAEEVGTYLLFKLNEGGKEVLYKINSKTGQVWCYSEYVVVSSDDLGVTGKEKEGLDKMIVAAQKQGKNVYTMPYWVLTSDEKPKYYTVK